MLFRLPSLIGLALGVLFAPGRSAGAAFLADGYVVRVWQTQDGLPQNLVGSAVQTRDGYLWFGTESGLARFDGERFQVFNSANTPELRDRRVTHLFEDAQGTLWIGHESGAITRYRAGRFELFAPPAGVENGRIIGLGSDEQGRLWAMRENGAVESLDGDTHLPSLIAPGLPAVMGWTRSADGRIWLTENGQAARLENGRLSLLTFPPPISANYVTGVAAATHGGVWVLCDSRARRWDDGRWVEDRGPCPLPDGGHVALELQDGTLAVGTLHSGLHLIFPDGRGRVRFDRSNGLPQDWVRFLYEDREGTLWAGIGSTGLVSIHATAFSVLNSPDQWQGCSVLSIAPGQNGALWIGTDGAGLYHHAAGKWTHYGTNEGLDNQYIRSVTETPAGEVWAGHYWWGSPYRLEREKFVRPENVEPTWSSALALLPVPETGELLVGNRDGLLRLKEGEPSRWLIHSPEGTADDVTAVARDRDGSIWCGFAQGGLARVRDGERAVFKKKDGLASDAVHCLLADEDGTLWIGTADNGLSRFKNGTFANLNVGHGLADSTICYILDDGLGYFWLSTHHGIQRVAKAELNRCADGEVSTIVSQIYDRSDGLPVVEFMGGRQAAGCKTSDGRLWFASSQGVVSVDPQRIRTNPLQPPVVLESLVVDGEAWPSAEGAVVDHLEPGHQRLEFHFSGLSFVAPNKVQFRYRLDGIDETWVNAGTRRIAFYSRLPAGHYRFRVIASNNDGLWNEEGASIAFTVAPFFWQTGWFLASCLVAAAGATAWLARAITRRRMQRRIEAMERQHAIELERARIAQDIHDDVGASLSRIAMLSQPARADLLEPARTSAMLSRIYTTAREVTRSLDEIVWAVNPRHDTLDSLVDYMARFAQDFLVTAQVRCRLDLPATVPAWPLNAEIRHNLFLAFKEALNNAVRHASATEVRIALNLQTDAFTLIIRDNGAGFGTIDDQVDDSVRTNQRNGNGLTNMRLRLDRIGGQCEIESAPGAGTTVALTVRMAQERLDEFLNRANSDDKAPFAN